MSRKRRERVRPEPRASRASRRAQSRGANAAPRRPGARRWLVALVLVLLAGGAFATRMGRHPRGAETTGVAANLSAQEAYARAVALASRLQYRESLPYFEAATARAPREFWELHYNYAAALLSVTRQYEERAHRQVAVSHSSVERVRLMHEAIRQLTLAAPLAPAGAARAKVLKERSNAFAVWGFPWESLISLRQAQQAAPGEPEIERQAEALLALIQDPTLGWNNGASAGHGSARARR